MNDLVHPRERVLGRITLILGLLVWALLIAGTLGGALLGLLLGYVIYLFAQSALIAHIKGNGVQLSDAQLPDLHAHFVACCEKLQMQNKPPQAYILNGNGQINAFATHFLRSQFVVLLSNTVDAMNGQPDGVRFYIGHELAHLRMKHLDGALWRWPVLWLPLLGAAYSRARESTCDRHGAACCESAQNAAQALVALAAGSERWKDVNLDTYRAQTKYSSGFWMSFHELISGYPWLTKRVQRVLSPNNALPARNGLAYLLAAWVPFAGRLGGFFGFVILVYIIGILAAVALPAYQSYVARAKLTQTVAATAPARQALAAYYKSKEHAPESLQEAGVTPTLSNGATLSVDPDSMVLTASSPEGDLVFTPAPNEQGDVAWTCEGGDSLPLPRVPPACLQMGPGIK
jgi:Zn-dependent protease with chaperone function/type II secretory pathway pseudopilin PulG